MKDCLDRYIEQRFKNKPKEEKIFWEAYWKERKALEMEWKMLTRLDDQLIALGAGKEIHRFSYLPTEEVYTVYLDDNYGLSGYLVNVPAIEFLEKLICLKGKCGWRHIEKLIKEYEKKN